MRTIYLDGHYLKVNDQVTKVFTPGVFRAKGVFETMLGIDGVALDASLHIKRMRAGLKALGIKPPSIDQSIFNKLLLLNKLSYARVRLMVWQAGKQVHMMAAAINYVPNKKKYRVCLIKTGRTANGRWACVKSLDYGLFAEAFSKAREKGFDDALLLNRKGHIFEASRANIFWISDNVLYTPPLSAGCLNGITRQQVIDQAKRLKIPMKEKNLTMEILKNATEVFMTNSLIGVKPIEITEIKIA